MWRRFPSWWNHCVKTPPGPWSVAQYGNQTSTVTSFTSDSSSESMSGLESSTSDWFWLNFSCKWPYSDSTIVKDFKVPTVQSVNSCNGMNIPTWSLAVLMVFMDGSDSVTARWCQPVWTVVKSLLAALLPLLLHLGQLLFGVLLDLLCNGQPAEETHLEFFQGFLLHLVTIGLQPREPCVDIYGVILLFFVETSRCINTRRTQCTERTKCRPRSKLCPQTSEGTREPKRGSPREIRNKLGTPPDLCEGVESSLWVPLPLPGVLDVLLCLFLPLFVAHGHSLLQSLSWDRQTDRQKFYYRRHLTRPSPEFKMQGGWFRARISGGLVIRARISDWIQDAGRMI